MIGTGIINSQTQWYLNKADQLRKVTLQLENYHPEGIRRKQRRINKALYMAKFIIDLTRSASIGFGSGELTEEQEATFTNTKEQIDNVQKVANKYFNYNLKKSTNEVPKN